MPKKARDADVVALAEAMLRALESLREQGRGPNPPTLRRLAALADGSATEEQIRKAATKTVFTKRAVVTEKVDKVPSLDSPVYFKEDAPKPNPPLDLARRMLLVLDAQRRLGAEAYPPTLSRLAELCDKKPSDTLVTKAATHATLSERAVVAAKPQLKSGIDPPVVFKEDIERRLTSVLPALLRFGLQPAKATVKKKPVKTHAFPPSEVTKRFVDGLKGAVSEALTQGVARRDLPADVAWVVIKGEPFLFLVDHLQPEAPRQSAPADGQAAASLPIREDTPTPTPRRDLDFADAFREAFDRLDRRNGQTNFVKLVDLRGALPAFGRDAFDAGLRALRLGGEFSLDSHEGLHGPLTPEEREAGVREAGSLLVYVSKR